MKILTFLLFISLYTACHVNKELVESIHINFIGTDDIILKYPKSQYITHFYDKKDDTIIFNMSKQQFDTIQALYTEHVKSYPTDTEIYLKDKSLVLTGGSIKKYNFSLNDKNNKIITLIDTGGDNVDKEFKNFMKFDVYIQKLLKSKEELKNKPDSNMPSF
ncbi:hypothetical protein [Empedobacter brevis]|uniref:hypothetical protein n=1 Tax=Empedobacter brevis TaxID=247 RepID=UPI00132024C9|nr:hypothetical protein [Empedobacter brevis]QHC85822.1 hypothetical protein AS589_14035 [Empedobacter brevis]